MKPERSVSIPGKYARATFRKSINRWAESNLRSFFWRNEELDSYSMLVVEVLLARTRAETVAPIARQFLVRFGSPELLAKADIRDLESILRPLGLYRKRAQALHRLGNMLADSHDSVVPQDQSSLLDLPYVGKYAANAVRCFSFNDRTPVLDANVARIFGRFFGLPLPTRKLENEDGYWGLALALLPMNNVKVYNWALLDLGSVVCRPKSPICGKCPLANKCAYTK